MLIYHKKLSLVKTKESYENRKKECFVTDIIIILITIIIIIRIVFFHADRFTKIPKQIRLTLF